MATIIVSCILLILISFIIYSIVRDSKLGKNSCGNHCSSCGGSCHTGGWKKEYDLDKEKCKSSC